MGPNHPVGQVNRPGSLMEAVKTNQLPMQTLELVTEEELKAAFEFFDVEGRGKITTSMLRKRLGAFYKNMTGSEYRFLMNNQPELTLQDLKDLLLENEVKDFDPVAEAFKAYDPDGTGFVNPDILSNIFTTLGFGELSEEDMEILIEAADVDGDGKISLEDYRHMTSMSKRTDEDEAEQQEGQGPAEEEEEQPKPQAEEAPAPAPAAPES